MGSTPTRPAPTRAMPTGPTPDWPLPPHHPPQPSPPRSRRRRPTGCARRSTGPCSAATTWPPQTRSATSPALPEGPAGWRPTAPPCRAPPSAPELLSGPAAGDPAERVGGLGQHPQDRSLQLCLAHVGGPVPFARHGGDGGPVLVEVEDPRVDVGVLGDGRGVAQVVGDLLDGDLDGTLARPLRVPGLVRHGQRRGGQHRGMPGAEVLGG